jgi:cephalosporin-C deacetylase-like acetyl esterase
MAKGSQNDVLGWLKLGAGVVVAYKLFDFLKNWNKGSVSVFDCPGVPSFETAYFIQTADNLEKLFYEDIFEDESAIVSILLSMKNDADVCNLLKVYGSRGAIYNANISLALAVNRYLSDGDIREVNSGYSKAGISYRFI